jgi:hypothetical protein
MHRADELLEFFPPDHTVRVITLGLPPQPMATIRSSTTRRREPKEQADMPPHVGYPLFGVMRYWNPSDRLRRPHRSRHAGRGGMSQLKMSRWVFHDPSG